MDRVFCQVFIQCSVSPLLSLVYYLIHFKWVPGCGDSPSVLHSCSAEPTHLPLLDCRNALCDGLSLSHLTVSDRNVESFLPPSHTEASGSDLSDTGRLVPITDALTARSHLAPALTWGKIHEDLSLGWAELNNRCRNTPQRGHADVVGLCGHQRVSRAPCRR